MNIKTPTPSFEIPAFRTLASGMLVAATIALTPMIACAEDAPAPAKVPAQEPMHARGPMPFSAFDKDGNGSISEDEFNKSIAERKAAMEAAGRPMRHAGDRPKFSDFDSDGNGEISPEELHNGQMMMMQKRRQMMMERRREMGMQPGMYPRMHPRMQQGMKPGMRPGMHMRRGVPTFSDFDLNGDGKITESEFNEAMQQHMNSRRNQRYPAQ